MAGMTDVGQARNQAIASITYWDGIIQLYDPTNPHITGVPALTALVTQLTMYLVRGAQGLPGYGKLIAGGLMGRTDFAKVFNLLANTDWPVYNYFRNFPNVFVNVVMRAASNAYGHQLNDAGPVFEGRLYNDPGMYANDPNFQANLLPQLKRDDWLRGIVNNIDKMTAISYPVSGSKKQKKNQRAEIESLGGYGAGVDQVPTNIVGNLEDAPIVELRGLKPIYSGMLTPMMLDLYRYIHIVNTAGLQNFPGEMLDMPQGDKFDLITNQGNSVAIRYQTVQNALADINHW
jgi:hypothetical protein